MSDMWPPRSQFTVPRVPVQAPLPPLLSCCCCNFQASPLSSGFYYLCRPLGVGHPGGLRGGPRVLCSAVGWTPHGAGGKEGRTVQHGEGNGVSTVQLQEAHGMVWCGMARRLSTTQNLDSPDLQDWRIKLYLSNSDIWLSFIQSRKKYIHLQKYPPPMYSSFEQHLTDGLRPFNKASRNNTTGEMWNGLGSNIVISCQIGRSDQHITTLYFSKQKDHLFCYAYFTVSNPHRGNRDPGCKQDWQWEKQICWKL